jgi:hypothetical protein
MNGANLCTELHIYKYGGSILLIQPLIIQHTLFLLVLAFSHFLIFLLDFALFLFSLRYKFTVDV